MGKPTELDPLISLQRLAILCKTSRDVIDRRLHGVEPDQKTSTAIKYRLSTVLPILTRPDDEDAKRRANNKERREKAEADSAEVNAARDIGLVIFKTEARAWMADIMVQVREILNKCALSSREKQEVGAKLTAIRLTEDQ